LKADVPAEPPLAELPPVTGDSAALKSPANPLLDAEITFAVLASGLRITDSTARLTMEPTIAKIALTAVSMIVS
jgi:hypothetical protein